MFSVTLIENQEELRLIDELGGEKVNIFSNPVEPICKENLSYMLKYLNNIKLGEGLDLSLANFGFQKDKEVRDKVHGASFKNLYVRATSNEVTLRYSYIIKSNNYAENLLKFFKVAKKDNISLTVKSCTICSTS